MENKIHNFEQVKDVLDYGIELHGELRALYDKLGAKSDKERVKMLLDYLSRHERNRAAAMERFGKEHKGHSSLDVWLQFAPTRDIEKMLRECAVRPDMTTDEVVSAALAFDDALIEIYKLAANEADDPKVQALFENLAEMEEKEKERFVRDAAWLQDI